MSKPPKKTTPEFKFKLAIEALKGERAITLIASDYGIHPKQIRRWRDQLMAEGESLFIHKATQKSLDPDREKLVHVIDQLNLELDYIKKKAQKERLNDRLNMIDSTNEVLSVNRQCDLFGVPRSSYYYQPVPETEYNLLLMKEIDQQYLEAPSYGSRLMRASLISKGFQVNRKRISRLMKLMGLEAMYPRPKVKTSIPGYEKFPYLLIDLEIKTQNQVWGTDITYIPLNGGFLYLVAFLDLYSRFVLSWRLSNSLESGFCVEALEAAFKYGVPRIVNSDQGVQYTSRAYIDLIRSKNVEISMSGKGRCWDNIFVERFWRTIKYDEVYLKQYSNSNEALECINDYINYYNEKRPHSALDYRTPMKVYLGK